MQRFLLSAAARSGPPLWLSGAPARPAAGAQDLWLVIGLLLWGILAGGGILCLLSAGLSRREQRLMAELERQSDSAGCRRPCSSGAYSSSASSSTSFRKSSITEKSMARL